MGRGRSPKPRGLNYQAAKQYGAVASAYPLSDRSHNLSFTHHLSAMAAPPEERQWWLERALEGKERKAMVGQLSDTDKGCFRPYGR